MTRNEIKATLLALAMTLVAAIIFIGYTYLILHIL